MLFSLGGNLDSNCNLVAMYLQVQIVSPMEGRPCEKQQDPPQVQEHASRPHHKHEYYFLITNMSPNPKEEMTKLFERPLKEHTKTSFLVTEEP